MRFPTPTLEIGVAKEAGDRVVALRGLVSRFERACEISECLQASQVGPAGGPLSGRRA
jgi:hypothetical protein